MLRIGLTGGIGSGKTSVSDLFAELGVPVIDTDQIARDITLQPDISDAIIKTFGESVANADGSINRKALAGLVFSDAALKDQLEAILHPAIRRETLARAEQAELAQPPYLVFVVPLLFETDFYQLVDRTLVVTADEKRRIERVTRRDGREETEIRAIIASQLDEQARISRADDVIENNTGLDTLRAGVTALHEQYLSLASST